MRRLLADSGLPGMKVLEFAFDRREQSDYMPHTYERNCVCYVGTHDNAPVLAWREEVDAADVAVAERYLGLNDAEGFHWGMIRGGMSSVANLFVAQLQDILGLGAESRMNTPGVSGGNWRWRTVQGALTLELAEKLASMTRLYGRESAYHRDTRARRQKTAAPAPAGAGASGAVDEIEGKESV